MLGLPEWGWEMGAISGLKLLHDYKAIVYKAR